MNRNQSKSHKREPHEMKKVSLSCVDDKIYIS